MSRLLVARLLIVLVPIVLLQVWVYRQDYRDKREAELQSNLEVARAVAVSFEAFLRDLWREEAAIGHALMLLASSAREQASAYLETVKRHYPEVVTMAWLAPDGQVLASSGPRARASRPRGSPGERPGPEWTVGQPSLEEIRRGREFIVTNVTRPQDIRQARFSVAHGAREGSGALRGIVVAVVDPNRLDRVINIRRSGGAAVALTDASGWFVARAPMIEPPYQERDWRKLYATVRQALAGEEGKQVEYSHYQHGRRIMANIPVPSAGWVAGAGRPAAEALGPVRAGIVQSALTFALVTALGVLLATVGARTITGPIRRLSASAQVVGAGSPETPAPESGPAELADLARAFNQMADEIRRREQALRESEEVARQRAEELQRLMDLAPIAIWVAHDPECRVITGNQAANRFYEALEGENVSAGPVSGEKDTTRRFFRDGRELGPAEFPMQQAAARGAEVLASEVDVLLPSGRRIAMLGNASPLLDARGQVRGSIAAFMDITERKRLEAALREARDDLEVRVRERTAELERANEALTREIAERMRTEQELLAASRYARSLIEASLDPLVTISPEGKITDVNEATVAVTGVPRDELLGTDFSSYFTEPEQARAGNQQVFSQGFVTDYPLTIHRRDGQLTHVLYNATLYRDVEGNVLGVFAAARDVTARKRAEEELRRLNVELEQRVAARTADLAAAQRLLETIMENTEAHLVYLDPDFNFVWVNSAYARACRRPKSDFPGHNHFEFYPHAENEAIFTRVRDTGEAAKYIEKPFEFPDMPERGVTYWDWTLTPVMGEQGRAEGLVFSLAEVTDKVRQRERLLAAERSRSELLATLNREISHRTKNNLAMVVGVLQLQIASYAAPSAAPERCAQAHRQRDPRLAEMLQEAIARIYAFAAVHDQLTVSEFGEANLTAAVRQCAEAVSRASARGRVVASIEGDEVLCPSIVATNLSVIANELITNAVKHGAPGADGSLQVLVRLTRRGRELEMSVWNSGNPVCVDLDLSRQTGLGLSLVQSIVVGQYRGSFTLEPKDGGSLAKVTVESVADGGLNPSGA